MNEDKCHLCHSNILAGELKTTYMSRTKYDISDRFIVSVLEYNNPLTNMVVCEECSIKIYDHITTISLKVRQ